MAWNCALWLSLCVFVCGFPGQAQAQQAPAESVPSDSVPGAVRGTVVDQTGSVVAGARVRITNDASTEGQEALTDDTGQFSFANIAPGAFKLKITAEGFATRSSSGMLRSGDTYTVPQIALIIASAGVELRVTPSQIEVAEDQIKVEEKQRLLGVVPNFYVSYDQHALPLTSRQKFELAWKTIIDPVNFGVIGAIAGIQQAQNDFSGYGQGAAGYGRRYGANWGNFVTGTYIGGAILPSLLKQDPRYFYKGTGSTRSRVMYAIANAVICKGDNGRWQPSYSNILGSLASGGVSNLYYPAKNRDGAELTFENALINIGATAATNILQEFVFRKLTPSSRRDAARPQSIIEEPSTAPSGVVEDRTVSTVYGSPVAVRN
jgi:hypothetical protein